MPLKLMYITNDPIIANIAENNGVDWIFIDLEVRGKIDRQGKLDTVISHHCIEDVSHVKKVLRTSKLLVRVNPIHETSASEINRVIHEGADIIMLPYFKTRNEVAQFVQCVGGRTQTCLLLETPDAVENLDHILALKGIDFIHIGLNDLHLGYKMKFMFELLADGTVEKLCMAIKKRGIPYGFGGIAQIGQGLLPAENILAEHYRLGSQMVILSRSFCSADSETYESMDKIFYVGVKGIREYEKALMNKNSLFFRDNRKAIYSKIKNLIQNNDIKASRDKFK